MFSLHGVFIHVLGANLGPSAVTFKAPYGVAVAAGRLIVSENTEGRCLHMPRSLVPCSLTALLYLCPSLSCSQPAPSASLLRLHVLELDGRPLQMLTPQGVGVSRDASFWLYGICADAQRAYVTDGCNGNVHVRV